MSELRERCLAYYKRNFPEYEPVDGLLGLEAFAKAERIKGMEAAIELINTYPYHPNLDRLREDIDAEIAKLKEGHGTTS